MPGQHPAGAVTGGAEGFLISTDGTCQHVGITTHVPGDQNRLANLTVRIGNLGMARWKRPGRPLAMDIESALAAVHLVGL